ncbi:MAG: hypothetical protein SPK52_02140 [Synergistales bacterium]|nr:hypothetical protein [Bacteroidales bacterium]MDY6434997.1 hypothetical protein [Synergistales bacterium]
MKAWRNRYRRVVEVEVEEQDNIYHAYFHTPDMKTMKAAMQVSKTDEIEGATVLINNCWISGADIMKEDGLLFIQMAQQVSVLFGQTQGRLKNL